MILYYCKTCGRWQDMSFADALTNAFMGGFLQNVSEETRQKVMEERRQCVCPAGHGPMVQVQPNDRIQVRLREVEKEQAE